MIIYLGTQGLLKDVPVNKVRQFEESFLTSLEQTFPQVLENFRVGKLDDADLNTIKTLASEVAGQFK